VTDLACQCGLPQSASEEPESPVVFDAKMGEYRFTHSGGGYAVIYHCPWCGGALPASKRASLFETITQAELDRLLQLTAHLKTVTDAIDAFGRPDEEQAQGMTIRVLTTEDQPSRVTTHRTLTFRNVSETADVILTDHAPDRVSFTFVGKERPLGPSK